MSRYPTNIYPWITGDGNTKPALQIASRMSIVNSSTSGTIGGGVSSITERWEVGPQTVTPGAPAVGTNAFSIFTQIVYNVLGRATSAGRGLGINRILPSQHPIATSLWASRITNIQGLGPNGSIGPQIGPQPWKLLRFDITWETPPYNMYSDKDLLAIGPGKNAYDLGTTGSEMYRFVTIDFEPSIEFVQRPRGTFSYPAGNTPLKPEGTIIQGGKAYYQSVFGGYAGRPIQDSKGAVLRIMKRRYTFTWYSVPDIGLYNAGGFSNGGFAEFIEANMGCVNADIFMNYSQGTMLLEGWKATPRTYPDLINPLKVCRCWDVTFQMVYFAPPTDKNDPALAGIPIQLYNAPYTLVTGGHNCVPHPKTGYWYRAFLTGGYDGVDQNGNQVYWKYQYAPFVRMFQMCA